MDAPHPESIPHSSERQQGQSVLGQPGLRAARLSAEALRARAPEPLATSALYSGLRQAGLQYGPAFRPIQNVQRSDDTAGVGQAGVGTGARRAGGLAQAGLGGAGWGLGATSEGYHLHPAALDGVLQLGAAVREGPGGASEGANGPFVPARVGLLLAPAQPLAAATEWAGEGRELELLAYAQASQAAQAGSGGAEDVGHGLNDC